MNYKIKIILIVVGFLILCVTSLYALEYYDKTNFFSNSSDDSIKTEQVKQQKQADTANKQNFIESSQDKDTVDTGSDTLVGDPQINLSAQKENDGTVTILTKITDVPNGSCVLNSRNGAKTNMQTAPLIYQTEFASCAGFSIPITALGNGVWNIQLLIESNGSKYEKTISYSV